MKKEHFLKTFVVVLWFIGCCFCVEQTVSLPGHYALSDIAAVSFPSSSVHILNSSSIVGEPFYVICDHLGSADVSSPSVAPKRQGLVNWSVFRRWRSAGYMCMGRLASRVLRPSRPIRGL